MAKLVLTVDTISKEFEVTLDGAQIPDVVGMSMYKDCMEGSKCYTCVRTMSKDEENGMVSETSIYASESPEGQKILASDNPLQVENHPELVAQTISKPTQPYIEYCSCGSVIAQSQFKGRKVKYVTFRGCPICRAKQGKRK